MVTKSFKKNSTMNNLCYAFTKGKISQKLPSLVGCQLYDVHTTHKTARHACNVDNIGSIYRGIPGSEILAKNAHPKVSTSITIGQGHLLANPLSILSTETHHQPAAVKDNTSLLRATIAIFFCVFHD